MDFKTMVVVGDGKKARLVEKFMISSNKYVDSLVKGTSNYSMMSTSRIVSLREPVIADSPNEDYKSFMDNSFLTGDFAISDPSKSGLVKLIRSSHPFSEELRRRVALQKKVGRNSKFYVDFKDRTMVDSDNGSFPVLPEEFESIKGDVYTFERGSKESKPLDIWKFLLQNNSDRLDSVGRAVGKLNYLGATMPDFRGARPIYLSQASNGFVEAVPIRGNFNVAKERVIHTGVPEFLPTAYVLGLLNSDNLDKVQIATTIQNYRP